MAISLVFFYIAIFQNIYAFLVVISFQCCVYPPWNLNLPSDQSSSITEGMYNADYIAAMANSNYI